MYIFVCIYIYTHTHTWNDILGTRISHIQFTKPRDEIGQKFACINFVSLSQKHGMHKNME